MEKFRKSLKTRNRLSVVGSFVMTGLSLFVFLHPLVGSTENMNDLMSGVVMGLLVCTQFFLIRRAYIANCALKNEDEFRKLYVLEMDERSQYIAYKSSHAAIQIIIYGLALAVVISTLVNEVVFITLLCVTLISGLIYRGFRLFYQKSL